MQLVPKLSVDLPLGFGQSDGPAPLLDVVHLDVLVSLELEGLAGQDRAGLVVEAGFVDAVGFEGVGEDLRRVHLFAVELLVDVGVGEMDLGVDVFWRFFLFLFFFEVDWGFDLYLWGFWGKKVFGNYGSSSLKSVHHFVFENSNSN